MIFEFNGPYRWLSNFWPSIITCEGITYPTVEHLYQAHKSNCLDYRISVAELPTPNKAKRAGQLVNLRGDWEAVKRDVMLLALRLKFEPGSELANQLLNTKYRILQEGNNWGDTYWGVCKKTGVGTNHLGKLLMQVRTELRNETTTTPN